MSNIFDDVLQSFITFIPSDKAIYMGCANQLDGNKTCNKKVRISSM